MESSKAFAPGNISCIFVIKKGKNPAKSGSLGLGFTVNKGVFATLKNSKGIFGELGNRRFPVSQKSKGFLRMPKNSKNFSSTIKKISNNKKNNIKNLIIKNNNITSNKINNKLINKKIRNTIYFNNKKINFPTVDSVIKKLTNKEIIVNIKSELPLGCGFGLSGASALATAYALNKLFRLKKSKKELAFIAHVAEVENGTGLGDVVNQYYGGFFVKYESSCKFKIKKLPIKNKTIYYKYISGINTKKIISNKKLKNNINKAGVKALNKIKKLNKKDTNLTNLIKISKEFSSNSKLLKNKKIIEIIKKIEKNNGNASMIMLGNAVFSDKYFKESKELIIKDKPAY